MWATATAAFFFARGLRWPPKRRTRRWYWARAGCWSGSRPRRTRSARWPGDGCRGGCRLGGAGRRIRCSRGRARPRTRGGRRRGRTTCRCRSCDTRSHIASECMDWRSGNAGRVAPGECSMPVPRPGVRRRSCLLGCEARGSSPRSPRSIRGLQARGKAGRVNASEPAMTPRNRQLREMEWTPG